MFAGKLKIYIAINIAFILLFGMILINFITLSSVLRTLVSSEISKCNIFASFIEDFLKNSNKSKKELLDMDFRRLFVEKMRKSGFVGAMVMDKEIDLQYIFGSKKSLNKFFEPNTKKAIVSGNRSIKFYGSTWGVFKPEKEYLIISTPLFKENKIIAGISISIDLKRLYSDLRSSQKIIIIYILLNTLLLTFAGVYFVSKSIISPLQKLLKRAEEFKDHNDDFFLLINEKNEFGRLSAALNRMLKRISEDKKHLGEIIESLEKANIELKKAQHSLVQAEKLSSAGRLSAGIAHEIGNPISIIIGYFELLKHEDINDEERKEYLFRAEKEINRISTIIEQLLHFSRPSKEKSKKMSVHNILNDIVQVIQVQPLMADINIKLLLNAEDDAVFGDSDQLYQVFMNLIINAADAIRTVVSKSDGQLTIKSENVYDKKIKGFLGLKVIFEDNGPGIDKDCIDKIFEPFYTTKEPGQGTGLGLSVCFMLIEKFGGKIEAASKNGCGTTVTIYLPLSKYGVCNE